MNPFLVAIKGCVLCCLMLSKGIISYFNNATTTTTTRYFRNNNSSSILEESNNNNTRLLQRIEFDDVYQIGGDAGDSYYDGGEGYYYTDDEDYYYDDGEESYYDDAEGYYYYDDQQVSSISIERINKILNAQQVQDFPSEFFFDDEEYINEEELILDDIEYLIYDDKESNIIPIYPDDEGILNYI